MSTAITQLGSLLAILATLTCLALASLVSDELRTRINRLPFLVLSLAARRLPPELRSEIYHEEWLPELCYLMEGDRIGPVTRLFRATRFAVSVWLRRGGERMARELAAHSLSMKGFVDIRTMSRARRREFTTLTTRLRELLSNDVGAPDWDWAARILTATAIACEACIEDRDERTAESLAQAASRLSSWLNPDHPAVLRVRRAAAYATLQLGHDEQATSVLRALCADETRILGPHHPGTFPTRRLVNWALADAGRFPQAEAGFRALHADLTCLPTADPSLRLHVQCMLAKTWLIADGVPEIAQARRLGHHLDNRVVETYSHVAPEVERRLLHGLERRWRNAVTTSSARPVTILVGTERASA